MTAGNGDDKQEGQSQKQDGGQDFAQGFAPDPEPNSEQSPERNDAAYIRIWCETLSAVLGQIAGQDLGLQVRLAEVRAPEVRLAESPAKEQAGERAGGMEAPPAPEVFLILTLAGALRGEQTLGLAAAQAGWLAAAFTGEPATGAEGPPGPAIEFTAGRQEALEELFRQVAGRAASALKPAWGEVQIHVQAGSAPSWPAATTAWLETFAGTAPVLALELRVSAALAAALRRPAAAATPQANAPPAPAKAARPATVPGNPSGNAPAPGAVNLDFLKNVPLDLTLRFGQRRMALREILELGPGSVIELDRHLKEPVDLLLDGQVLARGEVVVVQGCYGLRVTQIAARGGEER